MKTSIKIKKFWYADIADDGGLGTNWAEAQLGQREATVQFNGSDASVTNYPNVLGDYLESDRKSGEMTMNFQLADLTPDVIAIFTGGTVTDDVNSTRFEAAENMNQSIEKSIKFLTDKDVLFEIPRASFDGYPTVNDDDLHYYQMNSVVLKPKKTGVRTYAYDILKLISANDITAFSLTEETGAATVTPASFEITIEVAALTDVTALEPTIVSSLGASVTPNSGAATNFTSPVVYTVEAADGTTQDWTVTVTIGA